MLNELRPNEGARKNRKRRGRGIGSGLGKTSGKGHKGQNARSGGGVRLGFEGGQLPLFQRIPKRGFNNIFKKEYSIVNIEKLEELFNNNDVVTIKELKEKGLIKNFKNDVKILGNGELTKKLTVKAHKFSESAKLSIERAGGIVEEV